MVPASRLATVAELVSRFSALFPRPTPPTLPDEVIEAIRLYNKRSHQEVLERFLKSGDKNAVDANGRSVLHHAALFGKEALVTYFLKKGLDKELEDERGYTPLILAVNEVSNMPPAARTKVMACIETLLKARAQVISTGVFPQVAVNLAAVSGDVDVLKLLAHYGAALNDDVMGTPLWWAENTAVRSDAMIAYLHENGCTARMTGASRF